MSGEAELGIPLNRRVNPSPWAGFFRRLLGILFRPTATWNHIATQEPPLGAMLWPHAVVLVLARAFSEMIGVWSAGYPFLHAMKQFVLSTAVLFVTMWLFAMVAGTLAATRHGEGGFLAAFRLSGYALTPLYVCGVLAVLPFRYVQMAVDVLAMPWAFYVLGVGIVPMLKVKEKDGAKLTAMLCGALMVMWVLMPGLVRELLLTLAKQPA
ncbi:MAG: YIP1 family protein [Myxococcales bacterium]|nr:YIP1 family protein [Myxococcales bacterium]